MEYVEGNNPVVRMTDADIEGALEQHRESQGSNSLRPEITLRTSNKRMLQIRAICDQVVHADVPILILGESGVGQEVVAHHEVRAGCEGGARDPDGEGERDRQAAAETCGRDRAAAHASRGRAGSRRRGVEERRGAMGPRPTLRLLSPLIAVAARETLRAPQAHGIPLRRAERGNREP